MRKPHTQVTAFFYERRFKMKETSNHYLAVTPVRQLMIKFSVPCILSLLVSSLYNIVDQIFIGWGVGYLGNGRGRHRGCGRKPGGDRKSVV